MKKSIATLICVAFIGLTGCSQLAGLIKGPGLNANVQAGKENTQQIVANQDKQISTTDSEIDVNQFGSNAQSEVANTQAEAVITGKVVEKAVTPTVKTTKAVTATVVADKVNEVRTVDKAQEVHTGDNSKVIVNQNEPIPPWVLFLLILGWVLPTPVTMFKWVYDKLAGNKNTKE